MLQHAQRHVDSLGAEAGDVTAAERPAGPGKKHIPRVSSMLFDLEVLIRLLRSLSSTLAVSCRCGCHIALLQLGACSDTSRLQLGVR